MTVTDRSTEHVITRATGALGARIDGVDLRDPLDDERMTWIRELLLQHLVVVFSGQELSPADLVRFGSNWGELHIHPAGGQHPDDPRVLVLDSTRGAGARRRPFMNRGGWHSDVTWHE